MKIIPNTNQKYYMTKEKEVFNSKTGKKISQFGGKVCLEFTEGRRTKDVNKLYNMLFNMPDELKEIPFAKNYLISKDGRVFSKFRTMAEISPFYDKDGYKRIAIVNDEGKRTKYRVCRLVALTYLPNPNNLPIVNHINEKKDDDRVENLEWCDHSYNAIHSKTWLKRSRDDLGRFI